MNSNESSNHSFGSCTKCNNLLDPLTDGLGVCSTCKGDNTRIESRLAFYNIKSLDQLLKKADIDEEAIKDCCDRIAYSIRERLYQPNDPNVVKEGLRYLIPYFIWHDIYNKDIRNKYDLSTAIKRVKSLSIEGLINGYMFNNRNYPDIALKVQDLLKLFSKKDYENYVDEVVILEGY